MKKKNVIYEVPCLDCESVYIGETGRCLQKRLTEHKGAVRRYDRKNGIATHAWDRDHKVNWEEARVIQTEPFYWKRRVLEALWIKGRGTTSNLDCGLTVNPLWTPLFDLLDLTNNVIHLLIQISSLHILFTTWQPAIQLSYSFPMPSQQPSYSIQQPCYSASSFCFQLPSWPFKVLIFVLSPQKLKKVHGRSVFPMFVEDML